MAVAITHFTASDTMELNVVVAKSFGDLVHFAEPAYKTLSHRVPSQQDAQYTQCSPCQASAVPEKSSQTELQ